MKIRNVKLNRYILKNKMKFRQFLNCNSVLFMSFQSKFQCKFLWGAASSNQIHAHVLFFSFEFLPCLLAEGYCKISCTLFQTVG